MDGLAQFLNEAVTRPVRPAISQVAEKLALRHDVTLAVLAYGSALRGSSPDETLIDFYVLVEKPQQISANAVSRFFGRMVPPNVYYGAWLVDGLNVRAKYAVMTASRFAAAQSAGTSNPYFWARFVQPCRLVWARNEAASAAVIAALATAARTACGHAKALAPDHPWQVLFENTYRTELRPENASRAAHIVEADRAYFDMLERLLADVKPTPSSWVAKRLLGRMLSVARLAKAAFTFQGGADYAAWKIERHSGVKIEVTEWQRRHPLLAGILMLPRLLLSGGMK